MLASALFFVGLLGVWRSGDDLVRLILSIEIIVIAAIIPIRSPYLALTLLSIGELFFAQLVSGHPARGRPVAPRG